MKTSSTCALVALGATLALANCKKSDATRAAPSASAAAEPAAPGAAASASAAAPAAAKATTMINGKSLSDADDKDISAALKKASWENKGASTMSMGATTTITIRASKGSEKAKITLIKPSGAAETGSGMKMAGAKSQKAYFAKKGAALLDGDALLAVVIDGKMDDSQKLLDALVGK